jgi:hypothetical protein
VVQHQPVQQHDHLVIWDGDQILSEIRMEGGATTVGGPQFGRVVHTHGPGIDKPLDIIHMDNMSGGAGTILPIATWRGSFVEATDPQGNLVCPAPGHFRGAVRRDVSLLVQLHVLQRGTAGGAGRLAGGAWMAGLSWGSSVLAAARSEGTIPAEVAGPVREVSRGVVLITLSAAPIVTFSSADPHTDYRTNAL